MRVSWDAVNPVYSQGVSMGMLYPQNSPGVAWNGLISVTDKGDSSPTSLYLDGKKYADRLIPSSFAGTIAAFTYPDEFEACIGLNAGLSAQQRQLFGLCYRSNREIHIVYNAFASASSDQYSSNSDSPSPLSFSWGFTTTPVDIPGGRAAAHVVVMLDYAQAGAISDLEDILYGDDANDPSLPDVPTIIALFESYTTLTIVDNGDGTWNAIGPDSAVVDNGDGTFSVTWPSAIFINATTYTISSL